MGWLRFASERLRASVPPKGPERCLEERLVDIWSDLIVPGITVLAKDGRIQRPIWRCCDRETVESTGDFDLDVTTSAKSGFKSSHPSRRR